MIDSMNSTVTIDGGAALAPAGGRCLIDAA
jgi:hypothetical protein